LSATALPIFWASALPTLALEIPSAGTIEALRHPKKAATAAEAANAHRGNRSAFGP